MTRQIASSSSVESLKKEAKRWLKALRENVAQARQRLHEAFPDAPSVPTLRAVQHALAREHGLSGWAELKRLVLATPEPDTPEAKRIHWFLDNACPDHHVRGPADHNEARHTAMRLLEHHPEIARHDFITAIVCGDLTEVERALRERPDLARTKPGGDILRGDVGGSGDRYYRTLGPKGWDPLLFLTHTRLSLPAVEDNAVAIARLLLDHGADPNAWFMAGSSRYTPLVGAIGEGEEDRPPHQKRDELVRLLLERGANPLDTQVLYNTHFHGNVLWYFELMYELTDKALWKDPAWEMLPMGAYGPGAFFWLMVAAKKNDFELAHWLLEHGASPNTRARDPRYRDRTLYGEAIAEGRFEMAELLARHGAPTEGVVPTAVQRFTAAALKLDREAARALAREHPECLRSTDAIFQATNDDNVEAVQLLLDLGVSPDVTSEQNERPLHMAAYGDAVKVGELLIARGAEIDPVEKNWNNTPLDAAIYSQSRRMIALLGRHSRDPYRLAYAGQTERLRGLFEENPQLAKIQTEGSLLMWLPPESDDRALAQVELLLLYGADPNVTDKSGLTAADYAEKQELLETAALLRKATTADPSSLRSSG